MKAFKIIGILALSLLAVAAAVPDLLSLALDLPMQETAEVVLGNCVIVGIAKKPCNSPNSPGMKRLFAIPTEDITARVATNKEVATITKAATKAFVELNFTRYTGAFTTEYNGETFDSDNETCNVTIFAPQCTAALHAALDSYKGVDLTLVAVDANGNAQIVGDENDTVRMTAYTGGSGNDEPGERNGYQITFSKQRGRLSNDFYTGTLDDLLVAGI